MWVSFSKMKYNALWLLAKQMTAKSIATELMNIKGQENEGIYSIMSLF